MVTKIEELNREIKEITEYVNKISEEIENIKTDKNQELNKPKIEIKSYQQDKNTEKNNHVIYMLIALLALSILLAIVYRLTNKDNLQHKEK